MFKKLSLMLIVLSAVAQAQAGFSLGRPLIQIPKALASEPSLVESAVNSASDSVEAVCQHLEYTQAVAAQKARDVAGTVGKTAEAVTSNVNQSWSNVIQWAQGAKAATANFGTSVIDSAKKAGNQAITSASNAKTSAMNSVIDAKNAIARKFVSQNTELKAAKLGGVGLLTLAGLWFIKNAFSSEKKEDVKQASRASALYAPLAGNISSSIATLRSIGSGALGLGCLFAAYQLGLDLQ